MLGQKMKQLNLPGIETRKQYLVRMVREYAGRFEPTERERAQRELIYLQLKHWNTPQTH